MKRHPPPIRRWLVRGFLAAATAAGAAAPPTDQNDRPDADAETPRAKSKEREPQPQPPTVRLAMSPAVACRSIDGYENFEVLPDAALTADEKLLVYYRPLHYRIGKLGDQRHIHLTQDGQIRRRGEKAVLLRKEKLLDYEFKAEVLVGEVYLKNTVSLKGLKPGEYEYDITLHDELAKTEVAKQSLVFRVVAAAPPRSEDGSESGGRMKGESSRR